MTFSLEFLLQDAASFISLEFNIEIQQSKLKQYDQENWQKFCQTNAFNKQAGGIYIPQSFSAYINKESPFIIPNVFHELFGHGLFCEHSQIGRNLIDIIKEGKDNQAYLLQDINQQEQPFGLCKQNIGNYEGFAIWLEALLCKELEQEKIWDTKKVTLSSFYRTVYEYFIDSEKKLTRFGFMSQLGFPKYYNTEKVLNVLQKLYNQTFKDINFIILYGSQKPESDIDLCIISTNPSAQYFNSWLDIAELNREEFQERLSNLDIALTDAMFSGNLIYGNKNAFNQFKQKIINTSITPEIIEYNRKKSTLQKEYLSHFEQNSRLKKLSSSYITSYSQNAEQLAQGNKPLTLKNLQQIYS